MRKKINVIIIFVLLLTSFVLGGLLLDFTGEKIGLAKIIFEVPQRLIINQEIKSNRKNFINDKFLNAILQINDLQINKNISTFKDSAFCTSTENLNKCILKNQGKKIILQDALYISNVIDIQSNTTLIISENTELRIDDKLDWDSYCKTCLLGDAAVLRISGTPKNPIENVHIVLHGIISGTEYTKNNDLKYEGVLFKFAKNSTLTGNGLIKDIHGDGVDIDASEFLLIRDISVDNNSGTGIHLGSPRPITGSKNIYVSNVYASKNGFEFSRAGFDNSWPNEFSLFLIGNISDSNFINYDIDGAGVIMFDNSSVGITKEKNNFTGVIENFLFEDN